MKNKTISLFGDIYKLIRLKRNWKQKEETLPYFTNNTWRWRGRKGRHSIEEMEIIYSLN